MRKQVLLLSMVLVPTALSSSGDSRPRLAQLLETEARATLSAVKTVSADPISTGGVFVTNSSNTPVLGAFPINTSSAELGFLSGALSWGSSAGIESSSGIKGILYVAADNSGVVQVMNSGNSAGVQLSGNSGVSTFSGDLAGAFPSRTAEPGSVMSIDPARPGGLLVASTPYDRRVAGVVSGAKEYKPGITLRGLAEIQGVTLTLSGTVYCLASDVNGPVRAGDLLTSSSIPGYAQRAADADRARGAILGKAMEDLQGSRGHVLMLASLQ